MDIPVNLNVKQAAHRLGVSRSFLYERLGTGEIASLKCGKRRLVPVEALKAYQEACLVQTPTAKAA